MITDQLFQPQPEPEPVDDAARLDECEEQYKELLDAARDTGKTYLVAILETDGLAAWENASDAGDIEKLKTLFALLSIYVADQLVDVEGETEAEAFFARVLVGALNG